MTASLSGLKSRVLDALLAGDDPILATLREQVAKCSVEKREWTGVGFFTDLVMPADCARIGQQLEIGGLQGRLSGVQVGFLLFVRDGVATMLECFSYGSDSVEVDATLDTLWYEGGDPARDPETLRVTWRR